ncbi:MAG: hypothetical protein KAV82_07045 [Phycisphaerae bacterium]|nr:hypothetical protein [Phycisphaerae bacterium]
MNVKCLSAGLLMLEAAMGLAEPLRVPVTVDPNDPEKKRTIIPREEREQLGLAPHTWAGVVDPQAYATLKRQHEILERLNKARTDDAHMILFAMDMGFPGSVYVQVLLKHDADGQVDSEENRAAIRETQHRVLRSLTAAEFRVQQLFEKAPGFVGYASKEALDKLATNSHVAGVCPDDQPLPQKPKTIYQNDLPPAKPGEAADEPGVAEGRVDADVYRALSLTDRVQVTVSLGDHLLPRRTDVPADVWARDRLRSEAARQARDRFLAGFNADEFRARSVFVDRPVIRALVNREGVEKLGQHSDVRGVQLEQVVYFTPPKRSR